MRQCSLCGFSSARRFFRTLVINCLLNIPRCLRGLDILRLPARHFRDKQPDQPWILRNFVSLRPLIISVPFAARTSLKNACANLNSGKNIVIVIHFRVRRNFVRFLSFCPGTFRCRMLQEQAKIVVRQFSTIFQVPRRPGLSCHNIPLDCCFVQYVRLHAPRHGFLERSIRLLRRNHLHQSDLLAKNYLLNVKKSNN